MCYSPVCHAHIAMSIRLACLRHTASVYPEPGSNSLFEYRDIIFKKMILKILVDLLSELMPIRIKIFVYFTKLTLLKFVE